MLNAWIAGCLLVIPGSKFISMRARVYAQSSGRMRHKNIALLCYKHQIRGHCCTCRAWTHNQIIPSQALYRLNHQVLHNKSLQERERKLKWFELLHFFFRKINAKLVQKRTKSYCSQASFLSPSPIYNWTFFLIQTKSHFKTTQVLLLSPPSHCICVFREIYSMKKIQPYTNSSF